jgi:phosphoserine phosphatase RsbU/P
MMSAELTRKAKVDTKKVLVVDDQADVREALRLLLKGAGYATQTAESPCEALSATASGDPDLIVVDMNYTWDTTSGEEGLRLLDRLRAHRRDVPIVAMTGWSTIELAVRAMQRGACDFIPKPWDNGHFLEIVDKHLRAGREDQRHLDVELAIARKVQRQLLPQPRFQAYSLECECASIPMSEIGGDLYDFLEIDASHVGFVLADVSGKGIGAALLVANLQATIRAHAELGRSPSTLMQRVNQLFFESTRPEFFATVFYGLYESATQTIRYVNCGHPSPVVLKSEGRIELLEPTATVLGAFRGSAFREESVSFVSGDRLVLFSDGFSESNEAEDDPRWPVDRIQRLSRIHRSGLANALASLAVGIAEQADDITVMDIRAL